MKYLLTIISALFFFSLKAQTANIKSVEQKGQKIYITYDLKGNPGKYNIKLFVKSNNSYSWSSALKSVLGNVGSNQTVGINKQIIWDVLKDRDEFEGDWVFGIEAINVTEQKRLEESKTENDKKNNSNLTFSKKNVLKHISPSFGMTVGLQNSTLNTIESFYGSKLGFQLGVKSFFHFGKKIELRTSVVYSSKGAKYLNYNWEYLSLNYVEIPIDIAFNLGSDGFALLTGTYLAFLIDAKNYDQNSNQLNLQIPEYYKSMDFGLNFGISYLIANKFNFDIKYCMGLKNIANNLANWDKGWAWYDPQINNAFQFLLGLKF